MPALDLLSDELEDDPLEALVEAAVDDKVHDAVEHEEEVVDGGHAHEPDGRPEVVAAADDVVHVEELVEVEQEPGQVGDEEHAHHAHQNHAQLKVLGLKRGRESTLSKDFTSNR